MFDFNHAILSAVINGMPFGSFYNAYWEHCQDNNKILVSFTNANGDPEAEIVSNATEAATIILNQTQHQNANKQL